MPTAPKDRRTLWLIIVILCTAGALALGIIAGYILRPPSPQDYEARIVGLETDLAVAQEELADAQARNAELVTLGKHELAAMREDLDRIEAEGLARAAAQVQEIAEIGAVAAHVMQQAEALGIPLDGDDADEPLAYSWIINGQTTGALILYPNGRVRSPRGSKSPKYSWRPEGSGFHLQFINSRWTFARTEPGIFTGHYAGSAKSRLGETAELRALAPAAEDAAWQQIAAAQAQATADARAAVAKPKVTAMPRKPVAAAPHDAGDRARTKGVSFAQVEANSRGTTNPRWDAYAASLRGRKISGTGWVCAIPRRRDGTGYDVWIDLDPPGLLFTNHEITAPILAHQAATPSIGDPVSFSGLILRADRSSVMGATLSLTACMLTFR